MLFTRLLDNEGDSEKLLRLPGIEISASGHGAKFIGSDNTETHEQLSMDRGEVCGMEPTWSGDWPRWRYDS